VCAEITFVYAQSANNQFSSMLSQRVTNLWTCLANEEPICDHAQPTSNQFVNVLSQRVTPRTCMSWHYSFTRRDVYAWQALIILPSSFGKRFTALRLLCFRGNWSMNSPPPPPGTFLPFLIYPGGYCSGLSVVCSYASWTFMQNSEMSHMSIRAYGKLQTSIIGTGAFYYSAKWAKSRPTFVNNRQNSKNFYIRSIQTRREWIGQKTI
jgi:hypothetical protein